MKNSTNLHIFAKSILALVCLIAAQTVGAQDSQMNIYATKLVTVEDVTRDGRIATLRFTLNSNANSVTIYVDANDNRKFEAEEIIPAPYTMVGGNYERDKETTIKCTIPESLKGGLHNWAVKVQATEYNTESTPLLARAANNTDNRYKFHLPKALAISTNYDNPYCGYAFVGEAGGLSGLTEPKNKTSFRLGSSQGIYVFGPSLGTKFSDNVKTLEAPFGAFKGSNVDWWTADPTTYNHGPSHLATDKDGYVYVCQIHRTNKTNGDNSTEIHNRVWRVHADNLKEGNPSPAFECVLTTDKLSANGVSKRTLAIAVGEGSNGAKILYVISGTLNSTESTLDGSQKLSSWTIKENGDGTCTLEFIKKMDLETIAYKTKAGTTKNQSLISPLCSIAPDKEGGLWIFQKASSSADDEKFAALHLDSQWKADYRIPSDDYHNTSGGGAISAHYAKGNTSEYYLALPTKDGNNQVIRVFRIFKSEGYLTRALTYTITNPLNNTDDFGTLNAVAFDAANNLYFTSSYNGTDSNTGRLYVYALPKENEHTTSAPTTEQLNIPYKVTWKSSEDGYTTDRLLTPYLYSSDWLPTLSKEGYIFHGWYDESGNKVTQITRNITLTAKWTELVIDEKTLDNTPVINVANEFANGTRVNIKVNRKMQGGMFSSLCLPFDIEATTLANATSVDGSKALLAGASIWTFNDVQTEEDGVKILQFTQTQTQTQTVPAYTPFLIKPVNDIAEAIYFKNVIISNINNQETNGTITHDGITFTGVINPVELAAGSNTFFLVSDNRLAIPAAGGATLGGLRGYFTNPSGSKLAIRTQQNTPTLLESVNCNIKSAYKILQDGKIYIIRDGVMYDIKGYRL